MDIYARKDKGFVQFMDLIPKEEEEEEEGTNLELSLGPPGKNFTIKHNNKNSSQQISRSYDFDHVVFNNTSFENGALVKPPQRSPEVSKSNPVMKQPSSQLCGSSGPLDMHSKAFSPSVHISSLKSRIASGPMLGWPPVRSFRKNVTSSKESETENEGPEKERKLLETNSTKNKLVKINMDGIPIGRKVDLKTHDSYEKLSDAVDQLFRGFLAAAQIDASGDGIKEGDKAIVCLLDGSGEYSLVYEDGEGDKMLVGDVPWNMFISTVKRLRVLKSSEIPTLSRANSKGKCIS